MLFLHIDISNIKGNSKDAARQCRRLPGPIVMLDIEVAAALRWAPVSELPRVTSGQWMLGGFQLKSIIHNVRICFLGIVRSCNVIASSSQHWSNFHPLKNSSPD